MAKSDSLPIMAAAGCPAGAAVLAGLQVTRVCGRERLALLSGSFERVVAARKASGQTPYVAMLDEAPIAYAWVARGMAHIGQAGLSFHVPPGDAYLCEVVAIDPRGEDLVPEVLKAIVRREGAVRLWAAAGCYHGATAAQLEAAGFELAASLEGAGTAQARLRAGPRRDLAQAAACFLQLRLAGHARTPARGRRSTDAARAAAPRLVA
ncbi:MAG TPA: hypothetical protein VNN10_14640 [Dehalococcoidia bacterium]|nr:hypothetical protein [Dehalococcoidia bacterium]